MDLLGAYGSDSDSDDSSIEEQTSLPVSRVKKESIVHNNDNDNKETKKGKRLLQLNAILPQTIFERLSRPEEDSDSENENDSSIIQRSKRIPQKKSSFTSSSNQENNFFGSLLDDLKSVAPSTSSTTTTTTTSSLFKRSNDDEKAEKIGMALQTTSSIKRSKKTTNSARIDVVNVHDTTLSSDESHTEQTIEEEEPIRMTIQTSSRIIEKPKIRISAAPPIISKLGHDAIHPPATRGIHNETNNNTNNNTDRSQSENHRQPTISKREMEKALRAGNINLIHQQHSTNLVEMEGAPTAGIGNTTTKEEWEQMKMTHGKVNLRGLVSYDPKAGSDTTVNDLTSKHRSKHQIHQLMASAARLEAQRNSSLPGGNANSSGRNTHRTNAKRKYGW